MGIYTFILSVLFKLVKTLLIGTLFFISSFPVEAWYTCPGLQNHHSLDWDTEKYLMSPQSLLFRVQTQYAIRGQRQITVIISLHRWITMFFSPRWQREEESG